LIALIVVEWPARESLVADRSHHRATRAFAGWGRCAVEDRDRAGLRTAVNRARELV
jgi:hypothetical protein